MSDESPGRLMKQRSHDHWPIAVDLNESLAKVFRPWRGPTRDPRESSRRHDCLYIYQRLSQQFSYSIGMITPIPLTEDRPLSQRGHSIRQRPNQQGNLTALLLVNRQVAWGLQGDSYYRSPTEDDPQRKHGLVFIKGRGSPTYSCHCSK